MNWNRLIISNLLHPLRRLTVFAILQVLISPVVRLYNLFISLRDEQIMNQAGTSQVCMLQKIVHDKLNLSIDIEEDTGLTNDFVVKVASQELDKERQLVALIKKYKLAGKSFTLNNAAVNFVQTWSDYVCEKASLMQTWSDYVCEKSTLPDNNITIHYIDAALSTVTVTAEKSPCKLVLSVIMLGTEEREVLITHERTTVDPTPVSENYNIVQQVAGEHIALITLVSSDENYNYILTLINDN